MRSIGVQKSDAIVAYEFDATMLKGGFYRSERFRATTKTARLKIRDRVAMDAGPLGGISDAPSE